MSTTKNFFSNVYSLLDLVIFFRSSWFGHLNQPLTDPWFNFEVTDFVIKVTNKFCTISYLGFEVNKKYKVNLTNQKNLTFLDYNIKNFTILTGLLKELWFTQCIPHWTIIELNYWSQYLNSLKGNGQKKFRCSVLFL